jgi:hypothetical protein
MSKTSHRLIAATLLASVLVAGASAPFARDAFASGPNTGLIAYYDMNEKNGSTVFNKVSDDKHSQLFGATRTQGKYKRGLSFGRPSVQSGSDAPFAEAQGPYNLPNNEVTFAMWVKLDSSDWANDWQALVSDPNCCNYRILLYPGGKPYINAGQHSDWYVDSVSVQPDVWTHVALTIKGGGVATLYFNGQKVAEQSDLVPASLPNPQALVFGSGERTSGFYYSLNGKLDEVRVYDRALSQREIQRAMRTRGAGGSNGGPTESPLQVPGESE